MQEQIKTSRVFNEMTKSKPMKTYQMFDIHDFSVYPAHKQTASAEKLRELWNKFIGLWPEWSKELNKTHLRLLILDEHMIEMWVRWL